MCEYRPWDELMPDTLGLIFKNLPLLDILITVPRVCKSWSNAVKGPYCWQEIDIQEWSRNCQPGLVNKMVDVLVASSCGSLRKLSVYGLSSNSSLHFIADNANFLQKLQLPRSEISDQVFEQVAASGRLSTITVLDLSYCTRIGAPALKAIGKHCKHLTVLLRNMNPWDIVDKYSQDDEALAIASTMAKLKHLELSYLVISTESVIEIISNCPKLELLDVKGCWQVKLEKEFLEGFRRLKVVGPLIDDDDDCYGHSVWDEYSDYSGSSSYLAWDFVLDEMEDYDLDDDMLSDYVWDEAGMEHMFYDDLI